MTSRRKRLNSRNNAPKGRAGSRPAPYPTRAAQQRAEHRSNGIRLATGAVELLRLIWEAGGKFHW